MAPIATVDLTIEDLNARAAAKLRDIQSLKEEREQDETVTAAIASPAAGAEDEQSVESGRPVHDTSRLAWDGSEYADSNRYTYNLSKKECAEIENALAYFKGLDLTGGQVSRDSFPLPSLGKKLEALAEELHYGRGFFNVHGLDPMRYSPEDNVLIYLGVSSYVGERRGKQDDEGYMLAHVREANMSKAEQADRPFRDSNLALNFHTDAFADILGMQTRSLAAKGGNHIIASSLKIYNELAATRPDLLDILAEPCWHVDLRGRFEIAAVGGRPLLFKEEGHVILNFVPYQLLGLPNIPRASHLPCCTPQQVKALDAVQELAQKHQLVLNMKPGDMTFVNNLAVVHSREAFEDDAEHVRHLVRIWLKNGRLAWKLPPALQLGNKMVFYDEELPEKWNILPQPRLQFKIFQTLGP